MLLLHIFAAQYRVGELSPSNTAGKARTVEGALCSMNQMFASWQYADPRLQASGILDLRLHCQLQSYTKHEPPPHQVKPIPNQVLLTVITNCYHTTDPRQIAMVHMITLGFFFLLCPGKYTATSNPDATPFRLCNVHLLHNNLHLDPITCSKYDLVTAAHVALEFTNQKNGVRGELVGLGRSGHNVLCPVIATINRLWNFWLHRAPPTTTLCQYWSPYPQSITTTDLTQQLCNVCNSMGHTVGIHPHDNSIRSLCRGHH
jgi:hypothetical protein